MFSKLKTNITQEKTEDNSAIEKKIIKLVTAIYHSNYCRKFNWQFIITYDRNFN